MSKILVAFYLENKSFSDIDCTDVNQGNPGIGGTEYMIWFICSMLSRKYDDLHVCMFANNIQFLPEQLDKIQVENEIGAIEEAEKIGADILVLRSPYLADETFIRLEKSNLKVVAWSHNYEKYPWVDKLAACKSIKRNICVGREQYERLRDHNLFQKSDYIYNTIQFQLYENNSEKIPNSVCYIGSLHKSKGFHRLAKIWSKVEKTIPGAELYVIGSGRLYNKSQSMGQYGLAEESYENRFIKYFLKEDGSIRENIHFMGVMGGHEKIDFMKKMQVGVVSPTGVDETFCIGAVEFEAMGIPVVSIRKYALFDTVLNNETGFLFKSDKEFADDIIKILQHDSLGMELGNAGKDFVRQNFAPDDVLNKWHKILLEVYHDELSKPDYTIHNLGNNKKWLRELNRMVRHLFPRMPSIIWYENIPHEMAEMVRRLK